MYALHIWKSGWLRLWAMSRNGYELAFNQRQDTPLVRAIRPMTANGRSQFCPSFYSHPIKTGFEKEHVYGEGESWGVDGGNLDRGCMLVGVGGGGDEVSVHAETTFPIQWNCCRPRMRISSSTYIFFFHPKILWTCRPRTSRVAGYHSCVCMLSPDTQVRDIFWLSLLFILFLRHAPL